MFDIVELLRLRMPTDDEIGCCETVGDGSGSDSGSEAGSALGKMLLYIETIPKLCSLKTSIHRFRNLSVCVPPPHPLDAVADVVAFPAPLNLRSRSSSASSRSGSRAPRSPDRKPTRQTRNNPLNPLSSIAASLVPHLLKKPMVFIAVGNFRGPRSVPIKFAVMDFCSVSHSAYTESMVGESEYSVCSLRTWARRSSAVGYEEDDMRDCRSVGSCRISSSLSRLRERRWAFDRCAMWGLSRLKVEVKAVI